MRRVALFFGSFNPIHIGHLVLANYIAEYADVDEVRFVVSPQNPFKVNRSLMPDEVRYEMVQSAIASYSKFSVSDIEFSLPKPSYTCDTLRLFSETEKDTEFLLVMGGDNLPTFNKWKNYLWIASNYQLIVYPRPGESLAIPKELRSCVRILEGAPMMDISSTQIRSAYKEGRDLRYFMPNEVARRMKGLDFSNFD